MERNYTTLGYLHLQNPRGVFIGTRRKGARGTNPPKALARLRQYGYGNADRATFQWLYLRGARSAACCALSRRSPVGCMS